ncbi:hypothetical protein AGABI2DRAFT_189147 [Agaricus bisporus var. bisporus H97]|uniref:hypothetical protein n=1 Tax=Agaricus bisporus var. bisporus (strain H97 / ATCC MYA-4626 / FGSC 10389) TaxID=936046 RepID=UPI00029F4F3A|nr:hypothetical protein AGABI2DRAFT_189147 [Agaricus bisporus var. bisporus H97]EKV50790.1 hypothetical protein AGABI2DRAFT_189147 [Agaricus bisporus var. bisporus H97]
MPFFENARQFEINGGNFHDVKGNQNNYHYDQSLNVSGQGNSAVYSRGPYYNGANNSITNTTSGSGNMMVIGQGANAQVALNPNAMSHIFANQMNNYGQSPSQSYSPPPPAQPYRHSLSPNFPPPAHSNGMFSHSTGHVNQPHFTPQQQPPPAAHHSPPSSQQPVGPQLSPSGHHSQMSVHSAPANVQQVQINQSTTQPHAPQANGLVSSNVVSQQSVPPPADHQARPSINPLPGTNMTEPNQAGSTMSGTTLINGSQSTHATSPSNVSAPPATTATEPSTSSTSSSVATQVQTTPNSTPPSLGLSEYPDLILQPGATIPPSETTSPVEEDGKKKKKKKRKFFSRMFGKKVLTELADG